MGPRAHHALVGHGEVPVEDAVNLLATVGLGGAAHGVEEGRPVETGALLHAGRLEDRGGQLVEVDEVVVGATGRLAVGVGDDEGDPVDLVVHEFALLDQSVGAQAVPVVGGVDDDRVVELTDRIQVIDDAADHVVDQRAVTEVAGADLLESLPTVVAEAPHLLDQLLAVGLVVEGFGVAGMLRDLPGVIHREVGLGHQRRTVGTPEVGPQEEGLVPVCRRHLVQDSKRLLGDEVLDARFHRTVVTGEHLLGLVARVGADEAVGDRRRVAVRREILGVVIGLVLHAGAELQAGQHVGAGEGVADEVLAGETEVRGTPLLVDVPLAGIAAPVPGFSEVVGEGRHAIAQGQAVGGDAVLVGVEAGEEGRPGG